MIVHGPAFFPERGEAPPADIGALSDAKNGASANVDVSFWDLVDVINPLQHIPVVSTIYREVSGDEISGLARLAGGFLFGGPIGLASSAANLGIEMMTGDDLGDHVMGALGMDTLFGDSGRDAGGLARASQAVSGYHSASTQPHRIDVPV